MRHKNVKKDKKRKLFLKKQKNFFLCWLSPEEFWSKERANKAKHILRSWLICLFEDFFTSKNISNKSKQLLNLYLCR